MQENFKIVSDYDGLELDTLLYVPEKIKGIVLVCHGMAEYKERYTYFLESLCNNGYVACIYDHRGHGKSIRSKDDLGHFYDSTGKAIVDDAHQICLYLKNRFGNVPFILFGHSMGSLIVRCFARRYDSDIDKLIVCGSPSKNNASGMAVRLIDMDILLKGDHYRSKTMVALSTGGYDKAFPNEVHNSWLSVNKENVEKYNADPLCGYPFTLNGYRNLMLLMTETYTPNGWANKNPNLPVLFISGSEDPCAVNKESFQKAVEDFKSHGYQNVKHKMYEGYRHEILNEDIKDVVIKDIVEFIEG